MKSTILAAFLALFGIAGCPDDNKPCPSCPSCPTPADPNTNVCPTHEPCPDCPPPPECPAPPECPPAPECPPQVECPECPPPVECPQPPPPPVYEDEDHKAREFRMSAVQTGPETLGLFVSDPNGKFGSAVVAIPELHIRQDYQVLTLDVGGEETLDIGTAQGRAGANGLVTARLCEREFASLCSAKVVTNGPDVSKIVVTDLANPNNVYVWDADK